VDVESVRANLGFDGRHFGVAGIRLHDDDHVVLLWWCLRNESGGLLKGRPTRLVSLFALGYGRVRPSACTEK
jgi:hypothetical protein